MIPSRVTLKVRYIMFNQFGDCGAGPDPGNTNDLAQTWVYTGAGPSTPSCPHLILPSFLELARARPRFVERLCLEC